MPNLDTTPYWSTGDENKKTCDGLLNFDSKGLSYPGTSLTDPNRGSQLVFYKRKWRLQSLIFVGMPKIGNSFRDQFRVWKNKAEALVVDKLFAFKFLLLSMKYVKNADMLIFQLKPAQNIYPNCSLWIRDYKGQFWFAFVRKYNPVDGGNVENANTKEIMAHLMPVQELKEYTFGAEVVKWSPNNDGHIDVYLGGQKFAIKGPNLDKLLPDGILKTPVPIHGIYNWDWDNALTSPVKERSMLTWDFRIETEGTKKTIKQLMA